MMASLSPLVLAVLFSVPDQKTLPDHGELVCDDGSSLYDEQGQPRVNDCEIEACVVGEPLCWSERLDICYTEAGDENGSCYMEDKSCTSSLGCWGLYIACVGEWSCQDSNWWGCGEGTCTEPKKK
jgi:hypothetical protein